MIKIKVCGMHDQANAEAIARTGPDYLGFIFYRDSPRFVSANPDPGLFKAIPQQIRKVAVFVDEDPRRMLELAARYAIDLVQLHGKEGVDCCRSIRSAGFGVIKAFGIGQHFDFTSLKPYIPVCDYFLFDTNTLQHGGSGLQYDWHLLGKYGFDTPFFLSGGIGPGDEKEILELKHPALFGVDINSRFETLPGIKDVDRVRVFIGNIKMKDI